MSSPTRSEETHTQDSLYASSQHAVGAVHEDTESSARDKGHAIGSSAAQSFAAPNSTFVRRRLQTRGCSTSPVFKRVVSPLSVSVAQHRAQLAKRTAEYALSGVGHVAEETRRARGIGEAAIAEAKSVHGEIESKVFSLAAQAAASTAHITDALSKRVGELAAETEAKNSPGYC